MIIHLPDRIFFDQESYRVLIQQNKCGWNWKFHVIPLDNTVNVTTTGDRLNTFNYISIGTYTRENRTIKLKIQLKDKNTVLHTYEYPIQLLFEEKLTFVDMYIPQLEHFKPNNQHFKLKIIPLTNTNPETKVELSNWNGMQSIGLAVKGQPTSVEIPINNFTNKTWNYAVLSGHWIGEGSTLVQKNECGGTKPVTYTYKGREIEIVLKKNESLYYFVKGNNTFSGFGITCIRFFK